MNDDELIVSHLADDTAVDEVANATAGRPELAAELEAVETERDLLGDEATWVAPPPLSESIARAIADEATDGGHDAATVAPAGRRNSVDRRVGRNLRWSGAAALVAAAVVAVVMVVGGNSPTPRVELELAGTEHAPEASGTAGVVRTDGGTRIDLDLQGMAVPADGELYHGWVVVVEQPVSIGTFHMRDGSGTVVLWAGVDWDHIEAVTVTRERLDGSSAAITVLEAHVEEN
ncbi:MAG: anti-sigma factor [Acidimicrobiia bacterium]|nr:anti-sigma factor [Acidimicrobiia bacterium]